MKTIFVSTKRKYPLCCSWRYCKNVYLPYRNLCWCCRFGWSDVEFSFVVLDDLYM